ncbi:hypothetical protein BDD43_3973 [Mucilaginibacter gracilis]|uniref:Uncharacterized protein n=1 Tax=Mucilaginibacter gracilis TaxID=423350 RepID=A0A495J6W6_9SPHI|nr:hypothetical protein [Mucilaginibacter gracilis]RKR83759.1 hypothetical protein BDD43_3973 [Mucilaginibacter gracilis]
MENINDTGVSLSVSVQSIDEPTSPNNDTYNFLQFEDLYKNGDFIKAKARFSTDLLISIKNEEPDDFYESYTLSTYNKYYADYGIASGEWLNDLLTQNLNNVAIVCGILKILSFVEFSKLQSFARTMLMICIFQYEKHPDVEIAEQIIKCIEKWNDKAFINTLQKMNCEIGFIDLYKDLVLEQLQLL